LTDGQKKNLLAVGSRLGVYHAAKKRNEKMKKHAHVVVPLTKFTLLHDRLLPLSAPFLLFSC
jgi:hypothetical protein